MPFPRMRALAGVFLALAGVLASPSSAATESQGPLDRRPALEASVVREINRARSRHGSPALSVAPALRAAARSHSREMLAEGFFAHDAPDGTSFGARIRRHYSPRGWDAWAVGETIFATQGSALEAGAVVATWLASPPHRRIVLSRTWRQIGVGVVSTRSAPEIFGGGEAVVVTADFGLREGRAGIP